MPELNTSANIISANGSQTTRWLSEKEVQAITGISVSTLQKARMRQSGISYSKCGKSIRYDFRDVERFMRENKISTMS